jgi:GrpB-like predicted nucleotidyltransferase (UPF0157 family)
MPDQRVHIADYDTAWTESFAAVAPRLSTVLAPWLAAPPEHIGSTSVPGLPAKPIVDILAPVASLSDAQEAVAPLEAEGWVFWPDDPCRYYRLWFLRPEPEMRTHHLHVIAYDDPHARALLAFRDALRTDATLRDAYVRLKRDLAKLHPQNRNAYSNAKSDFVEQALADRGVEVARRDPLPE